MLPAAVIAIGADAKKVGVGVETYYPSMFTFVDAVDDKNAEKIATDVLATLDAQTATIGSAAGLPAVVVLASTARASQVATLIQTLRAQTPTLRPRVWPTFVTGETAELGEFDERLDSLGAGACDLVLMMNGKATAEAKAAALGAWLHVKMPAPPSVLGELPDVEGKICRYVAIGSATVNPAAPSVTETSVEELTIDEPATVSAVRADVAQAATKTVSVTAANDAASALCAAAEDLDAAALLRAENHLAEALTDVSRQLAKVLADSLPKIIDERLDAGVDVAMAAESETAEAGQTQVPAAEDRTQAVSQLVLLASKGGLSKMFSRSRMVGVAESVAAAARRDVAVAINQAIVPVDHEVPGQVSAAIARRAAAAAARRDEVSAANAQLADESWSAAMAKCRDQVTLWPRVDTSGVRRSWGGSAPSPRHYVVGSESALRGLPDDDDALSVIDLREPSATAASAKANIDLRDASRAGQERRATVLLAQYGLPLTAFPK